MIYPPPPGLTLLAYQFGNISKAEFEWRLKKWNEKRAEEEDQVVDRENVIEVLEKAKTVIENWVPMFEQYNTPAGIDYAIALLKEQEAVVRCKECKHYMTIHCTCDGCCISDDWYCADGERR